MKIKFIIVSIILNFVCSTGDAILDQANDPLYKLIATLRSYSSFVMRFEQENQNITSGQTISANGKVAFAVPDKFRWDYISDPQNIIGSDGQTLMMLLPKDKQVMIEAAAANHAIWSPLSILTDPEKINREYEIKLQEGMKPNFHIFKLKPMDKKSQYDHLIIEIPVITSVFEFTLKIHDQTGNINSLRFSVLTPAPAMMEFLPVIPTDFEKADFSGRPIRWPAERATLEQE